MKFLLMLLALIIFPSISYAQFPANILVLWDPNPVSEEVHTYTISVNGGPGTAVPASTRCNTVECTTNITIPSTGNYTLSLTASNFWGTSTPVTFSFNASRPGQSRNIRIRLGQ